MSERWPKVKLGELITHVRREILVSPNATYREIGIRSHGRGIFHKEPVTGFQLGGKSIFSIEPGDFVLNIVFAWEGAIAVAGEEQRGMVGSHRFPTFRAIDENRIDLSYLVMALQTPDGKDLLSRVSPGSAGRNRTLSKNGFLDGSIPLPPIEVQREFVGHVSRWQRIAVGIRNEMRVRNELASSAKSIWSPAILPSVSTMRLAEIADISGGMTPSTGNPVYWSDGTIAWVTPKDIKAVVVERSEDKVTQAAIDESRLTLHPRDSIVVVTRGMILARYVPIAALGLEAAVNQDVKVIRLKGSAPVSAAFLLWWMRGQERRIHEKVLRSTHDTRRLETRVLEDLLVPLCSEEEQKRFVACCQRVEALYGQLNALVVAQERDFSALDKSICALCE